MRSFKNIDSFKEEKQIILQKVSYIDDIKKLEFIGIRI